MVEAVKKAGDLQASLTVKVYDAVPVLQTLVAESVIVYVPSFVGSAEYQDTVLPIPLLPKNPVIQLFVEIV